MIWADGLDPLSNRQQSHIIRYYTNARPFGFASRLRRETLPQRWTHRLRRLRDDL